MTTATDLKVTWPTGELKFANIHLEGNHLLSVGILDSGRIVLFAPNSFEGIELSDTPLITMHEHLVPLRRIIRIDGGFDTEEEEAQVALPNGGSLVRASVIAGEPLTRAHGLFGATDDRDIIAGTSTVDLVLQAILDSLVRHPNQTKPFQAKETERIAQELDVRKFAVAGVRAALTKGMYGDTTENLVAAHAVKVARVQRERHETETALHEAPAPRRIGVRS